MIWIRFGTWNNAAGRFFVSTRIWRKGYIWTPFVKVRKRYTSWFGYWGRQEPQLSPSEALFGFVAWLTTRNEPTIMSRHDEASGPADRIRAFCEANNLEEPRAGWEKTFVFPKVDDDQ
jgi:hypothetical protein